MSPPCLASSAVRGLPLFSHGKPHLFPFVQIVLVASCECITWKEKPCVGHHLVGKLASSNQEGDCHATATPSEHSSRKTPRQSTTLLSRKLNEEFDKQQIWDTD